ncbi:Protein of unknown function [Oscillibacter sp. PC13]|uniref:RsiV family protein n=1 Tax=Oscillibacter sp. PC13 TaxID=1855299 RepID=UPI0008EB95CE|nr:RsiV family protein [Oscillibacter sp. PC13]SFP43359.1 Protein of unknown function [Oscillibacter sp. PC13]
MNELKDAKKEYEETPLPEELDGRVQAGIRQGRAAWARRRWRRGFTAVAACLAVAVGALNLSPTVAAAAADVPVLGGLFRILTVRNYEAAEDGINYQVSVPEVEAGGNLADKVNEAIQEKVDSHLEKARQDWEAYREAFFATGGTEEEWGDREMDVFVDYEVKSQTDTQVSFVVTLAEGWVSAMEEQYCYNLDLAENRNITLEDLLGSDWVNICNTAIQEQIDASVDSEGFTYFFAPEEGGFTTVDETTSFYINEDGNPVVVFPEYSIAAGAAGIVEFEIAKA